jgi:hypothetical protein
MDTAKILAMKPSMVSAIFFNNKKNRAGQDGRVASIYKPSWLVLGSAVLCIPAQALHSNFLFSTCKHPVRSRGAHGCARATFAIAHDDNINTRHCEERSDEAI